MANFAGYLIQGFPNQFIKAESYDINPNQREEIRAYRDDYSRSLYRITAPGMKTKISFSTIEKLHLDELQTIQAFFNDPSRLVSVVERKCQITYYDTETDSYKTSYFYRPNVSYVIDYIDGNDIIYKGMKITLIEY